MSPPNIVFVFAQLWLKLVALIRWMAFESNLLVKSPKDIE